MADPFLGEIRAFGFNFAPMNWAMCQGQIMPLQQNTALFSIIGVQFGGNGRTNFGLPNLTGQAPMGIGAGPGLTPRTVGDAVGTASVALQPTDMPLHTHAIAVQTTNGTTASPDRGVLAQSVNGSGPRAPKVFAYAAGAPTVPQGVLAANALAPFDGGGQAHSNLQPYLALNFCICLSGIFPPRP
ncbi:MAG: phage tail protein [Comamonadaceae bacterium]|nr:MAG: phage tail protein [Comamonadaceae bacterium]